MLNTFTFQFSFLLKRSLTDWAFQLPPLFFFSFFFLFATSAFYLRNTPQEAGVNLGEETIRWYLIFQRKAEGYDCPVTAQKLTGLLFLGLPFAFSSRVLLLGGLAGLRRWGRGWNSSGAGRKHREGAAIKAASLRSSISYPDQVNWVAAFPTLMHPGWHRNVSLKLFYTWPSFLHDSKRKRASIVFAKWCQAGILCTETMWKPLSALGIAIEAVFSAGIVYVREAWT